jgi:PAS domain S-box
MKVDPSHITSLFEYATEGIILTNGEGKIVLMNPASKRIFGYDTDELIGQSIEVLIPERFQHHHSELRENFYRQPQNRVMGHGRDLFARRKDGTDFPVEVSLGFYHRDGELYVIAFHCRYHPPQKDRAKYIGPAKRAGKNG